MRDKRRLNQRSNIPQPDLFMQSKPCMTGKSMAKGKSCVYETIGDGSEARSW